MAAQKGSHDWTLAESLSVFCASHCVVRLDAYGRPMKKGGFWVTIFPKRNLYLFSL